MLGDRIRTSGTVLNVDAVDVQVIGEQGRLEQVFVNLIQNALDAMGSEGRIDIDVSASSSIVTITVRDNGPGLSLDVQERLFQPFTTSKDDGLGLGLVICRDIIAGFGGELQLTPSPTGAAFAISLKAAS